MRTLCCMPLCSHLYDRYICRIIAYICIQYIASPRYKHSCRFWGGIRAYGKLHMPKSHFTSSITEALYAREESMLAKGSMLAKVSGLQA